MGCIDTIKDALSECSIKQRLRWLEMLSAAVPDAWASLKADVTLFRADDTVKEALLGWSRTFRLLNCKKCGSCSMATKLPWAYPRDLCLICSAGAVAVHGKGCTYF